MEKERNVRTNMGAISQTKLGQVITGAFSALVDMVNFEEIETIDEAIEVVNRENPEEAKKNEKIAKALEFQRESAKKQEGRVMDVTLAFGDENPEQKLDYLKVESQKVEPKKMVEREKAYQQATKEEKQKQKELGGEDE